MQNNIYLDEEEEKIIQEFKHRWGLKSKQETIKKIIREFSKKK